MPSGTTSLPITSPGMTAILSLLVAFAAVGAAIGLLLALPVARSFLRRLVYFSNPIRCDKRSVNASHAGPRADAGIGSCEVGSPTTATRTQFPSSLHDPRMHKPSMSSESPFLVAGGQPARRCDDIRPTARTT